MAIQLQTDGDGLFPSGATTTDRTPSFGWTEAGASFAFRLQQSAALIVSGSTSAARFTVPDPLALGSYQAFVDSLDASGVLLASSSGTFQVTAFLRPPRVLIPGDVVLAFPAAARYLRYFPQWMAVHGTPTAPGSAALTFRCFLPFLAEMQELAFQGERTIDQGGLLTTPVSLPRLWWHQSTPFQARDVITAQLSAGTGVTELRRVTTLHEFFTAEDPIFLVGDTGHAGFRNLALREVSVAPIASGASQYWLPGEPAGIVPDTDVLFLASGSPWQRLPAGSVGIDAEMAVLQLPPGTSGSLTVRYHSRGQAGTLTLSVSGQGFRAPAPADLWNRFDEWGVLAGLARFPAEDNLSFRERLYGRFLSRRGTDLPGLSQHLSQELARCVVLDWDGREPLDLVASGYTGIRRVDLIGVPEIDRVQEWLTPERGGTLSGATRFYASQTDWLPNALVIVDGRIADSLNLAYALSGNQLTFAASAGPISGQVQAIYQVRNYQVGYESAGFVTGVTGTTNLPARPYQVLLTGNTRIFLPTDPEYQRQALLTPAGVPNGAFLALGEALLADSPVNFGRSRWKRAYWAPESEVLPSVFHLLIPFDLGSDRN